jgi:hypothetical protein
MNKPANQTIHRRAFGLRHHVPTPAPASTNVLTPT